MKKIILIVLAIISFSSFGKSNAPHNDDNYLYRVDLVRATPGQLQHLVEYSKAYTNAKIKPYLMRHSQGDHWDLMLIWPLKSYQDTHAKEGHYPKLQSFYDNLGAKVNFLESTYMYGPNNQLFAKWYSENKLFHIEMFVALPNKKDELLQERMMESDYLINIKRKPNLLFRKDQGANWDSMTIGFYGSLKEFSTMADIPLDVDDKAAIDAGFKGVGDIGYYLRSLLQRHNDTLAKKP